MRRRWEQSGEGPRVTVWRALQSQALHPRAGGPAGDHSGRPGRQGAQRLHTPARDWLRPAVIQRRHVRAAAPSPPPAPFSRAWQESGQRGSGNKDPAAHDRERGATLPQTREHRLGPGPAPRPQSRRVLRGSRERIQGPGQTPPTHTLGGVPDSRNGDSRALLPEGLDPAPEDPLNPKLPRPSRPASAAALRGGQPPAFGR